ncbi:MAG: thymidine phosphorylase [Myxococcota bacterium]|nr:thymidine phosphorylase [Myxococcota bacterium]
MRVVDLLRLVRDNKDISGDELKSFIAAVAKDEVPDYQTSAFLMAACIRGLSSELTVALTEAMRDSGKVIDLSHIPQIKVDKHSTGGVGDKISIPLAPLVAACDVPVPMISGRGLGHTGGTLDKLESIPGFNVNLDIPRFCQLVKEMNLCLIGQTSDLAPADKKLYAMRDVTSTVESIPLITASILSKKLAEGIDALVLDVKAGRGAFMKDEASARELAESLVRVGQGAGLKVRAVITRMDSPLGTTIGNALEIKESLAILRGEGPQDSTELTMQLGAEMLCLGGVANNLENARNKLGAVVESGAGLDKFRELIEAQQGDPRIVDNPELLPSANQTTEVLSDRNGFIHDIDSYALGVAAMKMGAGRATMEDTIDPGVGIEILAKPGETIDNNQPIARLHHNRAVHGIRSEVKAAFNIAQEQIDIAPLIIDRLGSA